MSDDDPLTDLYSDDSPYDRERLATELDSIVRVDPETGEPVPQPEFSSLSPKEQAVALLLYRKVAAELGDVESEAVQMMWVDQHSAAEESDVANYPYKLGFVSQNDDERGLFVPDHEVGAALDFLERSS